MILSPKYIACLFLTMIFLSCGSSKTLTGSATANEKISTKQLIKTINANTTEFKTLVGKLKLESIQGENSQSAGVSLRWEKDKTIWISKLGIVKALITPTRVAFYNKLDNTYFDGDFAYLSQIVGTELDFNKLQNILLGETIFNLDAEQYKSSVMDNSYVLQPKQQRELFEIFFLMNPKYFKANSQQIAQPKERRILNIDYKSYQEVEKLVFPEHIKIIAVEDESEVEINLEFKNLELNRALKFPFSIPSGYEEIQLKND